MDKQDQLVKDINVMYNSATSYRKGIDALELAFREGQRDVVIYINDRLEEESTNA